MIYLDNAASTPCDKSVREVMESACDTYSNVHRSFHDKAETTTLAFENARLKVANFIGADRKEIVFTSGATEGINIVARGLEWMLVKGDDIMVTVMDHHSNLVPWIALANRTGATLKVVPIDNFGNLDERAYRELLTDRTKIVALPVVSNVLGTRNYISDITLAAHKVGALVLADAAQSIAHYPHDVEDMFVDFMVFSGHKMFGPTGIGALYIKEMMLDQIRPTSFGGGMPGLDVYLGSDQLMYQCDVQARMLETGTPPIIQAIGLGAAVDYLQCNDVERHLRGIREERITDYALRKLSDLNVRILGGVRSKGRSPLISFIVRGVHSHDVAAYLADVGIAVRAGTHCAKPLHRDLNCPEGSVRISLNFLNEWSDIDTLCEHITRIQQEFKGNTK